MTPEELQTIKTRCESTTPGEWVVRDCEIFVEETQWPWDKVAEIFQDDADADFIANAHADIPALIAEVERLQTTFATLPIDAIRKICNFTTGYADDGSTYLNAAHDVTTWLLSFCVEKE